MLTLVESGRTLASRSRRLTDPQERPVALSKDEYALLLAFLDAPGRPLSREYLLQATRLHEDILDRSIVSFGSATVLQSGIRLY
jgi:two-component system, OmpR family, response regulator